MALDFPASPSNGQRFTSGGVSWSFDGDKWKVNAGTSVEPVFVSSTAPTGVAGQIYWDSDESTAYIYYDDGDTSQWVPLVSTAPVSFDTSAIVSGTLPVARGGTGTTSFDAGKIAEGNTEAEVVDTGSDGHFKVTTEGTERIRVGPDGQIGLAGANYGQSGQVLESGGPSATVGWATPVKLDAAQTFTAVQTLTDPSIVGTILEDVYTITDGAAFEVDPGNGSVQLVTLGANRTPLATNFAAGESVTLMVDDGSAYTLTWTDTTWGSSGVVWVGGSAPTLATSGYSVIQFWKVSTTVYGAYVGDVA